MTLKIIKETQSFVIPLTKSFEKTDTLHTRV